MGFKTDIEIAQECEMLPITKIAENPETNEPEKEIKREEQLEVNIVQRQMQEESWTAADWSF